MLNSVLILSSGIRYSQRWAASPSILTDATRKVEVISVGFSTTGTVSYTRIHEVLLNGPAFHGGQHLLQREDGE